MGSPDLSPMSLESSSYDPKEDTQLNTAEINHDYLPPQHQYDEEEASSECTPKKPRRSLKMSSMFIRDDELDQESAEMNPKTSVAVHEMLNSDTKIIQGLLDPKMLLLRTLFDVSDWSDLNTVAGWVTTLFEVHNRSLPLIKWAIQQEARQSNSAAILFREDTMPNALASHFLKTVGKNYLQRTIGPVIQKMYTSKSSYEIDPNRPGGAKSNIKKLKKLIRAILKNVFESVALCPVAIREFLHFMFDEISEKFSYVVVVKTICSFFFLHYICPAIIYPTSCGIVEKMPTAEAQRGLILAAKVLQNLANKTFYEAQESHMFKMNKIIQQNSQPMDHFIECMSSKQLTFTQIPIAESTPAQRVYRSCLNDLQKYLQQKLNELPLLAEISQPTPHNAEQLQRLLKLRRAVIYCAKTWEPVLLVDSPTRSKVLANSASVTDVIDALSRSSSFEVTTWPGGLDQPSKTPELKRRGSPSKYKFMAHFKAGDSPKGTRLSFNNTKDCPNPPRA